MSRLKRRTWLLWTIPAISFLTCLLVFAYSLLSEGITPDTRRDAGQRIIAEVDRHLAIEQAIDVATTSFDPLAKLAKDIAAGAVRTRITELAGVVGP